MFGRKKNEVQSDLDSAWSETQGEDSDFSATDKYEDWPAWENFVPDTPENDQGNAGADGWGDADFSGLDVVVADTKRDFDGSSYDDDEGESRHGQTSQDAAGWDDESLDDSAQAPNYSWEDDGVDDDATAQAAVAPVPVSTGQTGGRSGGKRGAHATEQVSKRQQKKEEKQRKREEMPEHQRKSLRTRRLLIAILVLLLMLAAAGVYLVHEFITVSAEQMGQSQDATSDTIVEAVSADANQTGDTGHVTQKTQVPNLTGIFGMTQDEAVEAIGHGANPTTTVDINEEGNDVKKRITVELSEEPGDSKSGTPTVYLGLDNDGKVIMAGYSAATASLGYGTLSISDIITNEHVIENTLSDAGLIVEEGAVTLPEDASEYQTYDTDGTTLVRESVDFDGESVDANGGEFSWSGVLAYDYTAANASGNLADTVRQVYIYIHPKGVSVDAAAGAQKEPEAEAEPAAEEEPAPEAEPEAAPEPEPEPAPEPEYVEEYVPEYVEEYVSEPVYYEEYVAPEGEYVYY